MKKNTKKSQFFKFLLLSYALPSFSFAGANPLGENVNIPVIAMTVNHDDLYGPQGIITNPLLSGKESERPAKIEIFPKFTNVASFEGQVGIRPHGGASRTRGEKKSFKMNFSKKYNVPSLDFAVFGSEKLKGMTRNLVLKAGFNDSWSYDKDDGKNAQKQLATFMKDKIASDLQRQLGDVSLQSEYVIMVLNGKYNGLFTLVEAVDEDNFKTDQLKKEDITIMSSEEFKNGDEQAWKNLVEMSKQLDPHSPQYLLEIGKYLDLENFTHYLTLNFWLQNYDWPHQNWKAIKLGQDAKFKMYVWDSEYSFGSGMRDFQTDMNIVTFVHEHNGTLATLIKNLLKSPEFKKQLLTKFESVRTTVFSSQNLTQMFRTYQKQIQPHIEKEAKLLNESYTLATWNRAIDKALEFASARNNIYLDQLKQLQKQEYILCESIDFAEQNCKVSNEKFSIFDMKRLSSQYCIRGWSWGTTDDSIWVDGGCRALFTVSYQ